MKSLLIAIVALCVFSSRLFAQTPANDVCTNAIAVTVNGGSVACNNSNTVTNGPNPSCGGTTTIKDIWYKFVYTGGTVVIETQLGTNTDTRLAVYSACGGTQLACNDDYGGTYRSYISLTCAQLTVGNTYYIQAGGYNAVVGAFTMTVTASGILGCTDPQATNYTACATQNNGTCTYPVLTAQFNYAPTGTNCLNVQYTSTSSGNISGYSWSFPGGTPSTSTAQNPIVTYPAGGTYSASLIITSATGGTSTATNSTVLVTTGDIVTVDITPDANPTQTSWKVFDNNNVVVAQGTSNDATFCINSTCHRFEIYDSGSNGLTGTGGYKVYLNGIQVAQGATFASLDIRDINCPEGTSCNNTIMAVLGENQVPFDNTWFEFTPSQNGQYRISTCNRAACDTRIWIYDYCVMANFNNSNEATYTYNDDFCGVQAQTDVFMTGGHTYYIRVGSAGACTGQAYSALFEYVGPITGCQDVNACNYNPLASAPAVCYYNGDPHCTGLGPDLMVDQSQMYSSLTSTTLTNGDACLVNEGCLQSNSGTRQILRFTTRIANIGTQDYFIGVPNAANPQFTFDPCHNHYHYAGYAEYLLYDAQGNLMPNIGFKNGFCVLDLSCPTGITAQYSCGNMGITAGCADIYSSSLTCQWLDVTNVPAGDYYLVIRTNWDQSPDANGRYELRYDNNFAQVCLHFDRDANNNIINFTKNIATCPVVEDCLGIPFGDNQNDCAGNCPGVVLSGDANNDGFFTAYDEHLYGEAAINGGIAVSACTDLNQDGEITVADASYVAECIHQQQDLGVPPLEYQPCGWDPEVIDPESVTIGLSNLNTTNQTFDITVLNAQNELIALQLNMSGVAIQSLENLLPTSQWNPHFHQTVGGGSLAVTSELHTKIPLNYSPTAVIRVHYSALTSSTICISAIVDAINDFNHNVLATIGGCVYTVAPIVADFSANQTSICSGQSVTYTDASTGNPTAWSWTFPGGTPSSSTAQNPTVTYSTAGTYSATLVASNASSTDTEARTSYITVGNAITWYYDGDGDGYGNAGTVQSSCIQPASYVAVAGDCNDASNAIRPGAAEVCNGVDDDCDASVDEGFDLDHDGQTVCQGDCNDNNALVYTGAFELCNGADEDCDSVIDEGYDQDGDGYTVCNGDCNDANSAIRPGAMESCNGIDDNCSGITDEGFDQDGDGFTACNGDCNDASSNIRPNATEICNGVDDNCSGSIDEGFDQDGDGFTSCNGDCNDSNASINPEANEVCNGVDDDCNGSIDPGLTSTYYRDADGDGYGNASLTVQACSAPSGYVTNSTDCNDSNASIRPGTAELCNNAVDDNCNGQINENCCTVSASATATGSSCVASANGSVNLTVSGGVTPFTFVWSNVATTEDLLAVAPGTYSVTVTDGNGCTATASAVVTNLGQTGPAAPTAISGPNGVCRNSTGNVFTVSPISGATSYVWTLPTGATGSSTTNTITLSFSSTYNTGNLCVRAVNACGTSASYCRSVAAYISSPTTPGGISGPTVNVCAGTTQTYSIAAVSNATSYNWTAPAGATIASGQGTTTVTVSFSATFGTSGVLSVQSVNCFGSSTNRTLTIYKVPGTPAPISGQSTSVCSGSTQTYTIAAVAGATSYVWTAPTNATITAGQGTTTATVSFNSSFTTGTLSVVAASTCGQSTARTLSLTKTPTVSAISGTASNLCGGGQFTYSVTAVTGASTYNWTVPAGCSIATNNGNSIVMNIPSTFTTGTLTLVVTNTCGVSVTKTLALTALPATPASISGPASVCPNQTGVVFTTPAVTGVTQQWALPTGGVITAGQGTTTMTGTWGTIAGMVTVRSINTCGQSGTRGLSVSLLTCMTDEPTVDGEYREMMLEAFPNPNDGTFTVRSSAAGELVLMDELGRVIEQTNLTTTMGLQHTFMDLSAGVYFVRCTTEQGIRSKRVVVVE